MHLGGRISAKNGEGGGRLRLKIVLGGGRQGKTGKWEAGGRVKLVVGGGRQVIIELEGGTLHPCVPPCFVEAIWQRAWWVRISGTKRKNGSQPPIVSNPEQ